MRNHQSHRSSPRIRSQNVHNEAHTIPLSSLIDILSFIHSVLFYLLHYSLSNSSRINLQSNIYHPLMTLLLLTLLATPLELLFQTNHISRLFHSSGQHQSKSYFIGSPEISLSHHLRNNLYQLILLLLIIII